MTNTTTWLRNWGLWLCAGILSAGCATSAPPPASSVSGTATYRERIMLPPEAVFTATLEDVSRADAPSTVIGTARVASPSVPVSFKIDYDPARIHPKGRYVVRGRIQLNGTLMFTTDTAYPVLQGGVDHVDMVMRRVADTQATTASLENTYWKLLTMRGKPVTVTEQQREPHLILQSAQKNVAGSSGCNRLFGGYTLAGDRLSFGRTAGTMMACADGMEQEQAFLRLLPSVARWRINGQRLELRDARDAVLAEFEAVYLR